MRPVSITVSLSETTFTSKILLVELQESAFEHQKLRLVMTHVFKKEQEGYIPDLASFVGQEVKIEIADLYRPADDPGEDQILFEGFVSNAALEYEPGGLALELNATSGSANLDEVPRTRIWQDTTLGEIVDSILAEYQGESLASTDVSLGPLAGKRVSFVAQWGETDWEFLLRLCRKHGFVMVAHNRDLHLHLVQSFEAFSGMENPTDLVLGHNLIKFRLGLATANQKIQVSTSQPFGEKGLDEGKGDQAEDVKTWVGPSDDKPLTNALAQKGAERTWGSQLEGRVVEGDDHFSQQEFDAIAGRWRDAAATRLVQGRGECDALGLGVGSPIHVAPAGPRTFDAFEGSRFLIRSGTHVIDDGTYSLRFQVNAEGAPPMLDPAETTREPDVRLMNATVVDSHDPSNLGRVKVRLDPFAEDNLAEDIPARCLTESSGDGHGTLNLPEIGDEVLLAMDPRAFTAPTILGAAYNGVGKSLVANIPEHVKAGSDLLTENNLKYYLSKAGTCIVHDTTEGSARLVLATPSISVVMSEPDGIDIHVRGSGGECQITGDMEGSLTIKAKNISIEAEETISLKSGADMEQTAGSNFKLKANQNCDLESGMNIKVKAGQNYEMEAGMGVKEKASLTYEVNGGMNLKLQAIKVDIN